MAASTLQSTGRVIEEDIRVRLPLLPCTVPQAVSRIARSLQIPFGIELVPEPCGGKKYPDQDDEVVLTGLTVKRAFDRLTDLDKRYAWNEVDGVIVLRPRLAANDRQHFLHRQITFAGVHDGRMHGAIEAVQAALTGMQGPAADLSIGRTPEGDRKFSVSPGVTTALDSLNDIVRTHRSLSWQVEYCRGQARYEYAILRLNTFDGDGIGSHRATRREDGTMFDACSAR